MQTRKVVINTCFGGFGLSDEAEAMWREAKKIADPEGVYYYDIMRDDYDLVHIVETLGKKANSTCSQLKVVEIPADVVWYIHEYDGVEHIAESHRTWE